MSIYRLTIPLKEVNKKCKHFLKIRPICCVNCCFFDFTITRSVFFRLGDDEIEPLEEFIKSLFSLI